MQLLFQNNLISGLCDENDSKTEKLANAINELQQLLRAASEQYGQLETKEKEMQLKHEEQITKKNECIHLLKKELEGANQLLQATKEGMQSEFFFCNKTKHQLY